MDFVISRGTPFPLGAAKAGEERGSGVVNFALAAPPSCQCSLLLYKKGQEEPEGEIPFPEEYRVGNVHTLCVEGLDVPEYEYLYKIGDKTVPDPYGRLLTGRERWGAHHRDIKSGFYFEPFDWEGDRPLELPFSECVMYAVHPRGFTKHPSAKVRHRGTFLGIVEKIPYFRKLGVNQIKLMPAYEFEETREVPGQGMLFTGTEWLAAPRVLGGASGGNDKAPGQGTLFSGTTWPGAPQVRGDVCDGNDDTPGHVGKTGSVKGGPGRETDRNSLNYWGYTAGNYFAPKASYAAGEDPVREMKFMIRELHKNGIELIMEFYFTGKETPWLIMDCILYWVCEYHIDGVHLMGEGIPWGELALEPVLGRTKILGQGVQGGSSGAPHYAGEYSYAFSQGMRRFLKGDEEQLGQVMGFLRPGDADREQIHFITGHDGFTLMDLVSYDRKHNEGNGECNRDGEQHNYSWNCGCEGPSRKKKILQLRKRQMKNAFALMLLGQGVPMLLGGDEAGNSQGGNNNAYCQDNATGWMNWEPRAAFRDLPEFVAGLIHFRKTCLLPLFRQEGERWGSRFPDISFHGERAWYPDTECCSRSIGVLYGRENRFLYVAYNMYWEKQLFALPTLPKHLQWAVCVDTGCGDGCGVYGEGDRVVLEEQKFYEAEGRTVTALIAVEPGGSE